jgi:hypothetical protein
MAGSNVVDNVVKPLIFKAFSGFAARGGTPHGITAAAGFMLLIFMAFGAFAQPHPALFLGLMNEKGEPVQSEMEQAVRNAFAANTKIKLIDKLGTERIIREKERLGRSNMENFIPPGVKLDSSTVIIKGVVQDPVFSLKRHWLIWGKIDAQITVNFHFEEYQGTANYQGDFSASAMKKKEVLFFASARKNIHITAADRDGLLREMQSQIVKDVAKFATTFFHALTINEIPMDIPDEDTMADTTDTVAGIADTTAGVADTVDTADINTADTTVQKNEQP